MGARSFLLQKVNTWLSIVFFCTVALGAGYFVVTAAQTIDEDLGTISLEQKYSTELNRE